jgi:hypothetical protein
MSAISSKKAEIEKRLLTSFDAIALGKEGLSWLHEKPYQDFSNSWSDLQHYYQETQDPAMSIAVLDTYLEQTEILRKVSERKEFYLDDRRAARESLMNLEFKMQKICQSVINYNPEDT